MQLAGHSKLGGLKLWPEVPRDDGWVHHGLHDILAPRAEIELVDCPTHRTLRLHMLIYSLGVRHVLEHNLANLQRCFAKANLENLQIPALFVR